ncbi:MAG: Pup--protein ligase [Actinobacteria bacterium]|nr:Pup--protein ligase [Actinomycetota bacterium]
MPRRIFGIETEYGITCSMENHRRLTPDELARYLFSDIVDEYRSNNVFLPNGGRLYLDVGSHPEYATAECDLLTDVLSQEKAGDEIVSEMARAAQAKLASEGISGRVFVFKNNTDSSVNSYGCHENYLINRKLDYLQHLDGLLPFLVTRQLFCGAGKLLKTSSGVVYVMSQRADHMWDAVSSATTRSRPMINTRDEPHANSDKYRRLHVISGDSNMSETAMLLKVATMDLVLAVMEAGAIPANLRVDNPMKAIRDVARDLSGRAQVQLQDGRTLSAVETQRIYFELVCSNIERFGWKLSELHNQALTLWGQIISAFENGDLSDFDSVLDWRIKLQLLTAFQNEQGLALDSAKLAQVELMYHELSADRGIYNLLLSQDRINRVVSNTEIESATKLPPQTTRAKLRGEFLSAAKKTKTSIATDWMHLKVNLPVERSVSLPDPFSATDDRVQDLISQM